MTGNIPFNYPFLTGNELDFIADAYANGQLQAMVNIQNLFRNCRVWNQ